MKQIYLKFEGYWREVNKGYLPQDSGIYLIYSCRYIATRDTVDLSEILYIGQAESIRKRAVQHSEKEFSSVLKDGETLCYAYASVDKENLNLVENALVFAEKPQFNTLLKDNYSYEDVHVLIEGACSLMKHTDYTIATKKDGK